MSTRSETFGEFARRTRPDLYSQHTPDAIDEHVAGGLADDARRAPLIKAVRDQFGIKPDRPDTVVYDWLVNNVQHKFKVAPQGIRDMTATRSVASPLVDAAEQRYGSDLKTAGKLQATRLERQGVNAEQSPTENTQAQRERAMRNVPPLEAVAQDEGPSATPIGVRAPKKTYPLVNDWRDFMRIAREKEPGLNSPDGKRYAIRMLDQFPALVDKDNADEVVVMLDTGPAENASFPQDMVPGMNILSRFGPGSDVQQGIVAAFSKVYDPASRSSRGAPEGAVRTGHGLAEYGQDTGEDIAKRVPGAAKAAGSAAAWFGRGMAGLGTVASQAKAARLNALAEELKQRQAAGVPPGRDMGMFLADKEDLELADIVEQMREKADATQPLPRIQAQIYREAQQEIARRLQEEAGGQSERQTFAQYLKGATPEQAEVIGQDVLPQAGRMAANVANVVANIPSEVTLGAKAGMAALRSAPVDRALSGVGEAWAGTPVAKWFSNQPSALGVSSQKVAQTADTPNVAVRSFANEILHGPEAQKLATEHDLRTKFDAVFAKHGVPDEKKAELLSALGPTAENPELGRMLKGAAQSAPVGSTPAVMEDLLEVLRPEKSKLTWQTAVKGGLIRDYGGELEAAKAAMRRAVQSGDQAKVVEAKGALDAAQDAFDAAPIKGENPYHVIYGQNPLRAGGAAESKLARDVEETGGAFEDAYTKDIGKPASIADVAGASGLGAEAKRMVPMVPKSRADYIEAKRDLELSRGLTPKQADRASAKLFDKPITSQLAETHNKLLEMAGVFRRRASEGLAQQLFKYEQAKKGQYFANLSELERHLGTADDQASKLRTTYGQERAAEAAKVDVERYLADNGLVVIRTGDQPITSGGKMVGKFLEDAAGSPRVIKLPGGTEALHGKIVPRAVAKAVLEASEPQKNKILDWARAANKVLGANQIKAMMTIARPGFEQRNTFSDFIKAGMDEGFDKVYSNDNMDLWARISNAGPDEVFKVGNQAVTRRSLFTELGLGRGFSDATRREAIPEAGDTLAQALRGIDVDPAKWPRAYRWATRMTDARDAAASALAKPTLAYEKGVSRKAMWSGTDINPEYSSSDNIRMLHALSKIRRGASLRQAGVETTALMSDYANKSLAAQVAENLHFITFATYYGGAARSLATLAARNPRAYKHINDARLAIEGVDRALDQRGEYDPRTKPIAAQVGLMPAVTIGDQYTVADIENPAREAGQFTGRFAESGDESQATNLARALAGYIGPGWQAAYEGATGLNMGTGRPVLPVPLSSREYAELFGGAPHSKLGEIQAASDYAQREFGTAPWFGAPMVVGGRDIKPEVTLAYQLGKRALPGHVSSLLANALDIGYSPMREMPEAARSKLGRDVTKWLTGAGSYPVASVRQKVYKERQNAQATPLGEAIHRAVRAGKLQEAGK